MNYEQELRIATRLRKKAREDEAKKILDEFFDLHRLYYENKTRRLNNYD